MNLLDLQARIQRLEQLARGLAREASLWKDTNDLMLYRERKAYVNAVMDALTAVETARVTLTHAHKRLGRDQDPANAEA